MAEEKKSNRLVSYHVFLFPFKWEVKKKENLSFTERASIRKFEFPIGKMWENIATPKTEQYKRELFNEKTFFYEFAHKVLYDDDSIDNIVQHYERKEPTEKDVTYNIDVVAGSTTKYALNVKSISLNFYNTGVGVLLFYLENRCPELGLNDILRINQFGRRIAPPFIEANKGIAGTKESELANSISIEGLEGEKSAYFEDFESYTADSSNLFKPARFITKLISDFSPEIEIRSIIDDRMFVLCWFGSKTLSQIIAQNPKFKYEEDWYKYLFVDGSDATCQNDAMMAKLANQHTYSRWQKWGSLYGCSRYSLMFLSGENPPDFLVTNFRTIYTRIAELSLVQRASILKFSEEVSLISKTTSNDVYDKTNDIYKNYIHFVNKIYFREVTAQEQGIELYDLLHESMRIANDVKDLDKEIEELHQYLNILQTQEQTRQMAKMQEEAKSITARTDRQTNTIKILTWVVMLFAALTMEAKNIHEILRIPESVVHFFQLAMAICFFIGLFFHLLNSTNDE